MRREATPLPPGLSNPVSDQRETPENAIESAVARWRKDKERLVAALLSGQTEIEQVERELAAIVRSPAWIAISRYRQWRHSRIAHRLWLGKCYESVARFFLKALKLIPRFRPAPLLPELVRRRTRSIGAVADLLHEPPPPCFKFALIISGCPGDSFRYRAGHQAEQLELLGLTVDTVFGAADYDVVLSRYELFVLHRMSLTPELEAFIRRARSSGKLVIFDTDDLIFDTSVCDQIRAIRHYTAHQHELHLDLMLRHHRTMALCSAILVSTETLRDAALGMFPEIPVYMNRNAVSAIMGRQAEEALQSSEAGDGETVRIAYFSGTRTHQDDFDECAPALARLLGNYPRVRLMIVGHLDVPPCLSPFLDRLDIMPLVPWQELPALLRQTDINLAPLEMNNRFTAAKSELKYFEAGLLQVPTVASRVAGYQAAIVDGHNGFLCSSGQEWYHALERMIVSRELREQIANNARLDVLRRYTTRARAPEFGAVLSQLFLSAGSAQWRRLSVVFFMDSDNRTIHSLAAHLAACGHDVQIRAGSSVYLTSASDCDLAIATDFETAHAVAVLPNAKGKVYLMQDYEPAFYRYDDPKHAKALRALDTPLRKIATCEQLAMHLSRRDQLPVSHVDFPLDRHIYRNSNIRPEYGTVRILVQVPSRPERLAYSIGVEALYRVTVAFPGVEIAFYGSPVSDDFDFPYTSLGDLAPAEIAQAMNCSHIHLSFPRTAASGSPREALACGCVVVEVPAFGAELLSEMVDDWRVVTEAKAKAAAGAIGRLVDDAYLRRKIAREGERYVDQLPTSLEDTCRDFEELLLSQLFLDRVQTKALSVASGK